MKLNLLLPALLFLLTTAHAEEENMGPLIQSQGEILEMMADADMLNGFKLKDILVLTKLEFEVSIPGSSKLTIKPEVEFHWTR